MHEDADDDGQELEPESGDGPPKLPPVYVESYAQFTVKVLAHVKPPICEH